MEPQAPQENFPVAPTTPERSASERGGAEQAPVESSLEKSAPAPVAPPTASPPAPVVAPSVAPTQQQPDEAKEENIDESVWVKKTEDVLKRDANNPYKEEEDIEDLQIEYMKSRFGRDIKKDGAGGGSGT